MFECLVTVINARRNYTVIIPLPRIVHYGTRLLGNSVSIFRIPEFYIAWRIISTAQLLIFYNQYLKTKYITLYITHEFYMQSTYI
jgi:hypothetical protein